MFKKQVQLLLWNTLKPIAEAMGLSAPAKPRAQKPPKSPRSKVPSAQRHAGPTKARPKSSASTSIAPAKGTMEARYREVTLLMLETHKVRVRKWRTSMSGIAWYVTYRDGSIVRLIESPKPKGPMSMAVFLHEIGHHAIGFDVYSPRCLEEYHAWEFALRAMKEHGLNLSEQVMKRRRRSLEYAVGKACRRGIKQIPAELGEFIPAKYRSRYSAAAV